MPWHIEKRGEEWCVIKDSDGTNTGCSDSRKKAQAHLRALYASEAVRLREAADKDLPTFFERWAMDTLRLTRVARHELAPVIVHLGKHVANVVAEVGGLVMEDAAVNRVDYILTIAGLGTYADQRFGPVLRATHERAALQTASRIERTFGLGVSPDEVARYVLETGGRRRGLLDLNGHTREALMRLINRSREEGIAVKKLGRQVIANEVSAGRFVNAGPAYRGQLIARTETLHAQRVASLTSYRLSQKVQTVQAYDGDEDEECAARNGEYFSLDDADIETDAEHPNGTLAWGPITTEVATV